jgi:hypothetical protein
LHVAISLQPRRPLAYRRATSDATNGVDL